jgi:hypothetical protein
VGEVEPGRGFNLSTDPFPRPAPEPDVRLPSHPALHESHQATAAIALIHPSHGVAIFAPR